MSYCQVHPPALFQSTLPARGATQCNGEMRLPQQISIHAPREGSDLADEATFVESKKFQSTLPARGATEITGRDNAI